MKLHRAAPLFRLKLTIEDVDAWVHVGMRDQWSHGFALEDTSTESDRRDADRMFRIMTFGCRFCGSNSQYGEVHMADCIYVLDPSARQVWLRKGARIIE